MRKLASIQVVNAVEPIPNADAIERVRVLGWWVVGKKGDFEKGDQVVYCEIDSLLPERPEFEFLRTSSFKPAQTDAAGATIQPTGFRIKTVKLRGQVSQGICFPLSVLPPGAPTGEGEDVTDWLGVRKWEPPVPVGMGGKVKGGFPGLNGTSVSFGLARRSPVRGHLRVPEFVRLWRLGRLVIASSAG
ncbi:MAG: ligase, partial [Gemmataceae bacterium]|nr:ligase [Gemmataceae bacterium]